MVRIRGIGIPDGHFNCDWFERICTIDMKEETLPVARWNALKSFFLVETSDVILFNSKICHRFLFGMTLSKIH